VNSEAAVFGLFIVILGTEIYWMLLCTVETAYLFYRILKLMRQNLTRCPLLLLLHLSRMDWILLALHLMDVRFHLLYGTFT